MPFDRPRRRKLLQAGAAGIAGIAGCLGSETATPDGSEQSSTETPAASTVEVLSVVDLSITDFLVYLVSGTHPYVHRRANRQYVVVRVDTDLGWGTVAERLRLDLDGITAALAERQPHTRGHDDLEIAFAVPKDRSIERTTLLYDGEPLRSLATESVERLNDPPIFEVTEPSVEPTELRAGEDITATVSFTLSNVGGGRGTFGATLMGSLSGGSTVTETVAAGAETSVAATATVVGSDESAAVLLDWGSGSWRRELTVVGTETP